MGAGGGVYVGAVAGRLAGGVLAGRSVIQAGEQVVALLLPEALVYRHHVALGGENVLILRIVQRVVFIEQLRETKDRFLSHWTVGFL